MNGSHHIDVDDRLIPTGCTAVPGTEWDLRSGRVIADLDLDDAWSVPAALDGGSVHTLRSPDGRTVVAVGRRELRVRARLHHPGVPAR